MAGGRPTGKDGLLKLAGVLSKDERDLLYLLACALNGRPASDARVEGMDLGAVFALARRGSVAALAGAPLLALWEERPVPNDVAKPWRDADAQALMRYVMQSQEYRQVRALLEGAGVWHAPLKGTVLREHFPAPHLRECCDVDILIGEESRASVREIMEARGYPYTTFANEDMYVKRPYYNVEMHFGLAGNDEAQAVADHFEGIRGRLVPTDGHTCAYSLSDADFYLFQVTHAARHAFLQGGTGVRTLADFLVADRWLGDVLDRSAVDAALDSFGLAEYERACLSLAHKLFDDPDRVPDLSAEEAKLLSATMESPTYGTQEQRVAQGIESLAGQKGVGAGRLRYMLRRAFPPYANMARNNQTLAAHPWMLPYFWVRRIAFALGSKRHRRELSEALTYRRK